MIVGWAGQAHELCEAAALAPVVETGESERTCGLVSDSIARYGAVVHTRAKTV